MTMLMVMMVLSSAPMHPDFMDAVTKGDVEKVKQWLERDPGQARSVDGSGVSAVLKAVYYRKQAVVDLLIATGIELNIFEASATGTTARVRTLVAREPELVNAYSPDGFFPLGLAAFFGHKETVEALLAAGADVQAQSRESMKVPALFSATAAGRADIARLLLESGANPNLRAENGLTALHAAAVSGDVELTKLLLAHGADIHARANDGKTPLDFARQGKKEEIAALLLSQ
jgi:ankyrin repeat protein